MQRSWLRLPADWPRTPEQARALQERLRGRVRLEGEPGRPATVAGVDVHYVRDPDRTWAAAVLLEWENLELRESALAWRPTEFPYVPGLLSFRETPAVLEALACLGTRPDILFVDGHGYAHPRRFGIASHIGLITGIPTIGVAKSRLVGRHEDPGPLPGDRVPLLEDGEQLGVVLRTRRGVRPIYVSVGHAIDLMQAVALVLEACRGYRLPEPTRLADRLCRAHDP